MGKRRYCILRKDTNNKNKTVKKNAAGGQKDNIEVALESRKKAPKMENSREEGEKDASREARLKNGSPMYLFLGNHCEMYSTSTRE